MPIFVGNNEIVAVNIGTSPVSAVDLASLLASDAFETIPLYRPLSLVTASDDFLVTQSNENLITIQNAPRPAAAKITTASDEFVVTQLDDNLISAQDL